MKRTKIVWLAIYILITISSCHKASNNTLLQQKYRAQTTILQLLQTIDSLGSVGEYDFVVVKDYIVKVEEFGNNYPEDPMSAEFLYKAGLMAMTVAKTSGNSEETILYTQKALAIFENIQKIYPEFNGIRNCIINKGIIYEDILHDYENAEIFYREFIARYPTDTLAINLASYLQYLGKTPEDIMSEIEKK